VSTGDGDDEEVSGQPVMTNRLENVLVGISRYKDLVRARSREKDALV